MGHATVIAVRRATSTIPIVMVSVVIRLVRVHRKSGTTGGNITGLSTIAVDVSAKLVELFVELDSRHEARRRGAQSQQSDRDRVTSGDEDAVRKLNMQVRVVDARSSDEFERAFARLGAQRVNGVVLIPDTTLIEHGRRIAELAQAARLPDCLSAP